MYGLLWCIKSLQLNLSQSHHLLQHNITEACAAQHYTTPHTPLTYHTIPWYTKIQKYAWRSCNNFLASKFIFSKHLLEFDFLSTYLKKYLASSWASNGTSGRSFSPTPSRASSNPTISTVKVLEGVYRCYLICCCMWILYILLF